MICEAAKQACTTQAKSLQFLWELLVLESPCMICEAAKQACTTQAKSLQFLWELLVLESPCMICEAAKQACTTQAKSLQLPGDLLVFRKSLHDLWGCQASLHHSGKVITVTKRTISF